MSLITLPTHPIPSQLANSGRLPVIAAGPSQGKAAWSRENWGQESGYEHQFHRVAVGRTFHIPTEGMIESVIRLES